ncbi:MAG: hypothetical protein HYW49_10875 [Deltaproteobacteria bacterium]|nr:hypothetical protein [Deltaproteobacteria bacterium]
MALTMSLLLLSCSHGQATPDGGGAPSHESWGIEKFAALKMGVDSESEIEKKFGKPDRVVRPDPESEIAAQIINFVYLRGAREKLSVTIDPKTGRTDSAIWRVHEGEEGDLQKMMDQFAGATFKPYRPAPDAYPHVLDSSDIYYISKNGCVSIKWNRYRKEVESVLLIRSEDLADYIKFIMRKKPRVYFLDEKSPKKE